MDICRIPIINYHKIEAKLDVGITTRHPDDFERDMQTLMELNYKSVSFAQLLNNSTLPKNPVIITFDDGYQSVYKTGFPIMRKYGYSGTVFVPTAYIGRSNDWDVQFFNKQFIHLNKNEIQELNRNHFEFGSHGLNHRAFTLLSKNQINEELKESRKIIEDLTGDQVDTVCYPFGQFNMSVLQEVREAGYTFGLASLYFAAKDMNVNHLALERFNIYRFDSKKTFVKKLSQKKPLELKVRDYVIQRGSVATVYFQKYFKNEAM